MFDFPQITAHQTTLNQLIEIIEQTYGKQFQPLEWDFKRSFSWWVNSNQYSQTQIRIYQILDALLVPHNLKSYLSLPLRLSSLPSPSLCSYLLCCTVHTPTCGHLRSNLLPKHSLVWKLPYCRASSNMRLTAPISNNKLIPCAL